MSLAQVELMCADCSTIVYPKAKGRASGKHEFKDMSIEEIETKRKEWEKRYSEGRHILKVNF